MIEIFMMAAEVVVPFPAMMDVETGGVATAHAIRGVSVHRIVRISVAAEGRAAAVATTITAAVKASAESACAKDENNDRKS
jgi:hypothetical protein